MVTPDAARIENVMAIRAKLSKVLFLEVKSATGSLSDAQTAFRDTVQAQGFAWALVRSIEDALGALSEAGMVTRVRGNASTPVPVTPAAGEEL